MPGILSKDQTSSSSSTFSLAPSEKFDGRTSERFCAGDSDVSFRSADSCLFHVHRRNLEITTGGFPPSGFETRGEVVQLTEDSATLELLFQFAYPARHPDLICTPFKVLSPLAEAVEKYEVYPAISICKIRMRNMLPAHAGEVLAYAVKHGYPDIVCEAAPLLLGIPLTQVVTTLPTHLVIPWIRYSESWASVLNEAITYPNNTSWGTTSQRSCVSYYIHGEKRIFDQITTTCTHCSLNVDTIVRQVTGRLRDIGCLKNLDAVFDLFICSHIEAEISSWRTFIDSRIQQMPPFITYL